MIKYQMTARPPWKSFLAANSFHPVEESGKPMNTIPETNGHRKVNHPAQYAAAHRAAYPWYRAHLGAYAGVVRQPWGDSVTVEFQRDSDGRSVFVRRDHPEQVLAGYIDPSEPLPSDQALVRTCSQTVQPGAAETGVDAKTLFYAMRAPAAVALEPMTIREAAPAVETPAPAPVAVTEPVSRTAKLGQMIAAGLDIASRTGNHEQADRLMKAAWIVLNNDVQAQEDGSFLVRSQSDREQVYEVRGRRCSCPDWARHIAQGLPTWCCKHRASVALYTRLNA
jgi:hypothetical protein